MFQHINKFISMYWMILLSLPLTIYADVFTSVNDLEYLLGPHESVIDDSMTYVDMQEKRLSILRSYSRIYTNEHKIAMKDLSNLLSAPINEYIFLKRLVFDLNDVIMVMEKRPEYPPFNIDDPNQEDLIGAALAIARLQLFYNLEVKDLANGNISQMAYSVPMTTSDCYELGRVLLSDPLEPNIALAWMTEADRKYSEESDSYSLNEENIKNHMRTARNMLGERKNNCKERQNLFAQVANQNFRKKDLPEQLKNLNESYYEWLCREETELQDEVSSRLTCRYQTEHDPFTKLAPFKIEMLYSNPDIIMFHDILSDEKIDDLLKLGKVMLSRSVVQVSNDQYGSSDMRISKTAYLEDEESDVVARVSRRVKQMTGLNLETSESLQVANYGIGGFYNPHHDILVHVPTAGRGNRLATVLFYMTNVIHGGATVFLNLGLRVKPVKGSAIYWLNIHPSGEQSVCLLHAACPVLIGSKWVATKWIREGGQEFIKPCNLEHQKRGCLGNFPPPINKNPKKLSRVPCH